MKVKSYYWDHIENSEYDRMTESELRYYLDGMQYTKPLYDELYEELQQKKGVVLGAKSLSTGNYEKTF